MDRIIPHRRVVGELESYKVVNIVLLYVVP
jgi:hypothetical protein